MKKAYVIVDWEHCDGCDPCLAKPLCTTRAIVQPDPGEAVYVEQERCNGCGKCVPECLFMALSME